MVKRKNKEEYRKIYILMVMKILFIDVQIRYRGKKESQIGKILPFINFLFKNIKNHVNKFCLKYINLLIELL